MNPERTHAIQRLSRALAASAGLAIAALLAGSGCGSSSPPQQAGNANQAPKQSSRDRAESDWRGRLELHRPPKDGSDRRFATTDITNPDLRAAITPDNDRAVVLVHGLDDPGWLWDDLIVELNRSGMTPIVFTYPNDGPVVDAADDLGVALQHLRAMGFQSVDLVGHSMGGLVSRELLTADRWYHGDARGENDESLPPVERLIMVGTPNHGSELARWRSFSEISEKMSRLFEKRAEAPAPRDPATKGQAGQDLLPTSEFLAALNARPLPEHIDITIIAGQWLEADPTLGSSLESIAQGVAAMDNAPEWFKDWSMSGIGDTVDDTIEDTSTELGDGAVTITSTRLDGVEDHQVVNGNHWSILVRLNPFTNRDEQPIPPAVPIILDRLSDDSPNE